MKRHSVILMNLQHFQRNLKPFSWVRWNKRGHTGGRIHTGRLPPCDAVPGRRNVPGELIGIEKLKWENPPPKTGPWKLKIACFWLVSGCFASMFWLGISKSNPSTCRTSIKISSWKSKAMASSTSSPTLQRPRQVRPFTDRRVEKNDTSWRIIHRTWIRETGSPLWK